MGDLDEEQIAILKEAFYIFSMGEEFITPDTVGQIFRLMGAKVTEEILEETIAEIDEDGSGQIEFEEFCVLAAKFCVEEDDGDVEQELKEAFRLYSDKEKGYITTDTLKTILREIAPNLSEEQLQAVVDEVDEDGSGTLDFDEFMEMMNG